MPPDPSNREALSDRRTSRGALQAAHEAMAEYPAIVAMHEEQTERADAEVARLRAALEEIAAITDGIKHEVIDFENALKWAKHYAREALNGGQG